MSIKNLAQEIIDYHRTVGLDDYEPSGDKLANGCVILIDGIDSYCKNECPDKTRCSVCDLQIALKNSDELSKE